MRTLNARVLALALVITGCMPDKVEVNADISDEAMAACLAAAAGRSSEPEAMPETPDAGSATTSPASDRSSDACTNAPTVFVMPARAVEAHRNEPTALLDIVVTGTCASWAIDTAYFSLVRVDPNGSSELVHACDIVNCTNTLRLSTSRGNTDGGHDYPIIAYTGLVFKSNAAGSADIAFGTETGRITLDAVIRADAPPGTYRIVMNEIRGRPLGDDVPLGAHAFSVYPNNGPTITITEMPDEPASGEEVTADPEPTPNCSGRFGRCAVNGVFETLADGNSVCSTEIGGSDSRARIEIENGFDDDCDGIVDEVAPQTCGGSPMLRRGAAVPLQTYPGGYATALNVDVLAPCAAFVEISNLAVELYQIRDGGDGLVSYPATFCDVFVCDNGPGQPRFRIGHASDQLIPLTLRHGEVNTAVTGIPMRVDSDGDHVTIIEARSYAHLEFGGRLRTDIALGTYHVYLREIEATYWDPHGYQSVARFEAAGGDFEVNE